MVVFTPTSTTFTIGDPGAEQLRQAAPGVVLGVGLEEVVLAAVARELELGTDLC